MQWSSPQSSGQLFRTIQLQFCQHLCLQSSHQRTPECFYENNKSDTNMSTTKRPSFWKHKVVTNCFWLVCINSILQFLRVLFKKNPFRATKIRLCRKMFENWWLYILTLTAFKGSVRLLYQKFEGSVQEDFFPEMHIFKAVQKRWNRKIRKNNDAIPVWWTITRNYSTDTPHKQYCYPLIIFTVLGISMHVIKCRWKPKFS